MCHTASNSCSRSRQYLQQQQQHSNAQQCTANHSNAQNLKDTWKEPAQRRNMARAVARLAERAAAKIQALFISVHVACCKGNFGRDHDTSLCLIVFVWIGLFWLDLCFLGCHVMAWISRGCYWLLGLLVTSCCKVAVTWEYHRSLCHKMPHGPCCTMLYLYVTMCLSSVPLPGESEVGKGESSREVARRLLAVFILQRGRHFQEEDGRDHSNRSASTLPYHALVWLLYTFVMSIFYTIII